jgi:light-regulated signal transduction histidine kinase (bacteriophytochrome)
LQQVDMQSVVEDVRAMLASSAEGRSISWQVESLPVIVGDENMLRQVWQNLIGNAIKYTQSRVQATIQIGVRRVVDEYIFSISDNGVGFDMQHAGKLFGVFQRLHKAAEFPGSGIGLANVRRIVARHQGHTWAEGALDKGATFFFSLPASLGTGESTGAIR